MTNDFGQHAWDVQRMWIKEAKHIQAVSKAMSEGVCRDLADDDPTYIPCPLFRQETSMDYFDLGTWTRKITTTQPKAQLWFDRSLNWLFGFNHEEAIVCFELALQADGDCVMAHWGIAHCIGPNYNKL